jgi:hypothetical protein
MLNHIRLMFAALFMGLFLVACGNDSAEQEAVEDTDTAAPTEMASEEMAEEEAPAAEAADSGSIIGMTEEEVIAKMGEPDLTQTRTLDALSMTHHEWHGEDSITAVQFQDGVAKFTQNIPVE